jgi:HlyD family secretion protein
MKRLVICAGIGLATIGAWSALNGSMTEWFSQSELPKELLTELTRRDTLRVTANERGTIDSVKNSVLTSNVAGTTTILKIVREGTHVKEGDIVVELDASVLTEKVTSQRIKVTQANAALEQAKKQLEIQEQQNLSDIAAAELKLKLAKLDLEKFLKGDFEQQKNELAGQVKLAEQNLARAVDSRDIVKRLAKKGYKTQADLEVEEINVKKSEIDVSVSREKLSLLELYTYTRTLEELEANSREFARELERVKLKAQAALAQAKADLEARELTASVENAELDRLNTQVASCVMRAPQDGQVVYANPRESRSDQPMIEEGTQVRERQAIINLPDLSAMKVVTRVHESRISLIRPGLGAWVTVDAYPDKRLRAVVEAVGSVPSATSFWNRDIKEYEVVVKIDEPSENLTNLRPGLTAGVEVLVEERPDSLIVPVQSVITIGTHHFAFVATGNRVASRELKIGLSNDRMVQIVEGVVEGDRVVMNPKTHFSTEIADLTSKFGQEKLPEPVLARKTEAPGATKDGAKPEVAGPGGKPAGPGTPEAQPGQRRGGPGGDPVAFFKRMDKNSDSNLSEDEFPEALKTNFSTWDANGDGVVSLDEFQTARKARPAGETAIGGGGGAGG